MSLTRRELAVGLMAAGANAGGAMDTLYIPKPQMVEDLKLLHDFMDEFAFADLVTATPEIRITHIPVRLDRETGAYGRLYGHVSRANPHTQVIEAGKPAVVVFHGPHAYISPTWYAKMGAVPTWNFATVHASGTLKPIADPKALHDLLAALVNKFEDYKTSEYDLAKVPANQLEGLMRGIIGFELEIDRLEGKFKLGQDRSPEDQASLLHHLEKAKPEESIYDFTARYYRRR
jgi:transcriptional regulator